MCVFCCCNSIRPDLEKKRTENRKSDLNENKREKNEYIWKQITITPARIKNNTQFIIDGFVQSPTNLINYNLQFINYKLLFADNVAGLCLCFLFQLFLWYLDYDIDFNTAHLQSFYTHTNAHSSQNGYTNDFIRNYRL